MRAYRVLRRDDHHEMPWRNGEGSTLQVVTSPEGAGLDDFGWRVSFARVERSGPFSRFAGVDRVITLVDGAGLRLIVNDGSGPRVVDLGLHEPFAFAGEDDVSCEVSGPTLDLNLMTRRLRCVGSVRTERVAAEPLSLAAAPGEDLLVAVLAGEVSVRSEAGEEQPLGALDVVVDVRERVALTGEGGVAVLRVADPEI